jgi:ribonuclease HI
MEENKNINISYTNWKGETRDRNVQPINIWFGETKWHKGKQWFLKAIDIEKEEERDFAVASIHSLNNYQVNHQPKEIVARSDGVKEVKLYTDGGSRGNPGPSAIGFVIMDMGEQIIVKESKYLGITTNNQAEYQGLKQGLEMCHKLGFSKINIYMDSLLVINQMKGIYKVKNRDLWPIYDSVREYINNFKHVSFTHVPRELNKLADGMVNECLDEQTD